MICKFLISRNLSIPFLNSEILLRKWKPVQIYILGAGVGFLNRIITKPFSETGYTIGVFVAISICLYGVYRYFKK